MNVKADILIVTATKVESKAVMEVFKRATGKGSKPTHIGGLIYQDLGKVNGASVFLGISEMGAGGRGGTQESVRKGIEALTPSAVIMAGIAFGVNEQKQHIGDILVSQQLWLYDLQRVGADVTISRGDKAHASPRLINWFQNADLTWKGAQVRFGLILTGDKLVDNIDYRDQLRQFEPEAIGGEMEGAGLYVACENCGVGWILVKGICDWADGNKAEDKDRRQRMAAHNAASFVLAAIQQAPIAGEVDPSISETDQTRNAQDERSDNKLTSPLEEDESSTIDKGIISTFPISSPEPEFPIFEIPYRHNPNFIEREQTLEILQRDTSASRITITPQVLTGLGGIGKTQMAIDYAYRHAKEYDLVWWIRADEASTLFADYLALANRLQLPVKTGAEQQVFVNVVRNWLESTLHRWLLIFDNAEDPEAISQLLPTRGNGDILLTSRNPDWHSLAVVLPSLKPFTLKEASEFLARRTGQHDEAATARLVELLGGLPLAFEQAGAFISKLGLSLASYVELYEKQRKDLWQHETPPSGYKATVTTTWELAFQRVKESSPAGLALLNICIFLAPDEIPLSIFRTDRAFLPEELAEAGDNPFKLEEAVAALYHFSLIGRQGDNLAIHRLVQEVARERLGPEKFCIWVTKAVKLVGHVFPYDKYDLQTWPRAARLLPHALAVATYGENCSAALNSAATIWQRTGEYLRRQGEYARAQKSIEHALAIREQSFGKEHELVAESLDYLGELFFEQGHYSEAYPYHEKALAIRQRCLGEQHADSALSLNNLGRVFYAQGNYDQAREYFEAALAIAKQALGEQHPYTATNLNDLGLVHKTQGQYKQAREYFEAALAIDKQTLGEQHPDTAKDLGNLGGVYQAQGQYQQAREYYEAALAIDQQALGEQHPGTAKDLNSLGGVYYAQGQYKQAREYFEAALAILKQTLGAQHPYTATNLNNLGLVHKTQGQYKQARECFETALVIDQQALGEQHPDTAKDLNSLGGVYYAQGQYQQAREYYEAALAILKQTLGAQHPYTATNLNNLGLVHKTQGQYKQAREYYEAALAIDQQVLGEQHPDTAKDLNNLGGLYQAQGQYKQAREYYEAALAIHKQALGAQHPDTATNLNNLGGVYQAQGQYKQALEYYEAALAILKQTLGEQHPDAGTCLNNLGTLLLLQNKHAAARPYFEQSLEVYQELFGDSHPTLVGILSHLATVMLNLKQYEQARRYSTQAIAICQESTEEIDDCIKMKQLLKSLPGPIGRHKNR